MTKDLKKLNFTFPEGTPQEQIRQIKSMKSVVKSIAKLTGKKIDTKPFDDAIKKLS